MSIRNGIYDLLSAIEGDVYPFVAPQETAVTYIVYTIRREPVRTQDGITAYDVYLTLNIYADELDDLETMGATFESGLEGASGTYDSETLHVCNWVSTEDGGYLPDLDKHQLVQEYQMYFI
jgi:hypothetical protein